MMSGSATNANPLSKSTKMHVALSSPQSFMEDVTGAYSFGTDVPHFSSLVKISKFFSAPLKLEKLLTFGQIVCLDSLLWMLVIFPLRFLFSLVILISSLFQSRINVTVSQRFDLVQGVVLGGSVWLLYATGPERIYGWLEHQNTLKLHVIYSISEVFDGLVTGFGKDIVDGLFLSLGNPEMEVFPLSFHIAFAIAYVAFHSFLFMISAGVMNVALHDSMALITLIIRNKLSEIKRDANKKHSESALFEVCCDDVIERFQEHFTLWILIFNLMSHSNWDLTDEVQYDCIVTYAAVIGSEIVVDWTKYSFMTMGSDQYGTVYSRFGHELTKTGSIESLIIGRQLGLGTKPLVYMSLISSTLTHTLPWSSLSALSWFEILFGCWICVLFVRCFVRYLVLTPIFRYYSAYKEPHPGDVLHGRKFEKGKKKPH